MRGMTEGTTAGDGRETGPLPTRFRRLPDAFDGLL